jgi:hypothetical protein
LHVTANVSGVVAATSRVATRSDGYLPSRNGMTAAGSEGAMFML